MFLIDKYSWCNNSIGRMAEVINHFALERRSLGGGRALKILINLAQRKIDLSTRLKGKVDEGSI